MKVYSIFNSVSGEVGLFRQGEAVTFLRLAECNLTCEWCDSMYAHDKGSGIEMSLEEVTNKIYNEQAKLPTNKLIVTGGEPLLQQKELANMLELYYAKFRKQLSVAIETNGSILPIYQLAKQAYFIFDYKLGSSGMTEKMLSAEQFCNLPPHSWIKFVCCSLDDLYQANEVIDHIRAYTKRHPIYFAITPAGIKAATLYNFLMNKGIADVVINVQLHKLLNLPEHD